jgi:hypothetical protein
LPPIHFRAVSSRVAALGHTASPDKAIVVAQT